MKVIMLFFYIIALAAGMALLFKRKIEETISLAIFSTILILYFCGLFFGTLSGGVWLCVALSILSGMYATVTVIKEKELGKEYCWTPGIMVFLMLFIYIWWLNKGRMLSAWDEFSHWGLVVKNMYVFDYFGNHPDSTVTFRSYPPATALWQYFVLKLCGEFKEDYIYQAMGWFMGSLLLPVLKNFNLNKIISAGVSVLVLALIPLIFYYFYPVSLLVDTILGILLGYLLLTSYYDEKKDRYSIINASLAIMVLCLTKESGIFLSAIYVAVVVSYDIFSTHNESKERKDKYICWIFYILALGIGKFSWSIYLSVSSINQADSAALLKIVNLINLMKGRGKEYQYTVINNFLKALSDKGFTAHEVKLNYFFWVAVIGGMYFLLKRTVKTQQRKKLAVYTSIMYLGLFVYTLGLLFLYVFKFSEYEAVNLASFQRYLSTWFVGIFIFDGAVLLGSLADYDYAKRSTCFGIIGCVLLLLLPMNAVFEYTLHRNQNISTTIEYRQKYKGIEKYASILDYSTDCVHIVAQNSLGEEWLNCSFSIVPVKTIGAWSLGEAYYEGDSYTKNFTVEEYLQLLNNNKCTYVYLAKIDKQFIEGYGELFGDKEDIKQGCLYKIERTGNKTCFIKVEI